MKKLLYIIAIVAMMSTAVQGYAQGREGRGRGHRTEQRAPQSRSGNRGSQPQSRSGNHNRGSQPQSRGNQNHGGYSRGHNAPQNRNHGHYTPPRHNNHGHHHHTPPPPRHNHYRHHHHHCHFTDWCWYTWNGYANRYRYYRNCYWDSFLGYYIYGSMSAPTRIDIGGMSLARYGNSLKIQNGSSVSYMDLWLSQTVSYSYNNTSIVITTGGGRANIRFYDAYGNSASYIL